MTTKVMPVEPGHRIQLPAEWTTELGLSGFVTLEKTAGGILIRACPPTSWDEVFATKLAIGQFSPPAAEPLEVTGDDLLY
jgi:hypothetical protein